MRGYTEEQLAEVFWHLGIGPHDFLHLRRSPSLVEARARLQGLKDRAHRERKRLALELHPDRTGGDEAKTELFKRISAVVSELENSQVQAPPPRPAVRIVVTHFNTTSTAAGTTFATNNTTNAARFTNFR